MSWRSALIITYGRTGSTLLTGLLNRIDGYLIRGENNNCFHGLFHFLQSLEHTRQLQGDAPSSPTSPWFNEFQVPEVTEQLVQAAKRVICSTEAPRVYGFKELWYPRGEVAEYNDLGVPTYEVFEAYLDFLGTIFPGCCFLLNTRRIDDTVKSEWWAAQPETSRRFMEQAHDWYARYMSRRSNCFQIAYEDLIHKNDRLQKMYDFLGEAYDETTVDGVLAIRHSYSTRTLTGTESV